MIEHTPSPERPHAACQEGRQRDAAVDSPPVMRSIGLRSSVDYAALEKRLAVAQDGAERLADERPARGHQHASLDGPSVGRRPRAARLGELDATTILKNLKELARIGSGVRLLTLDLMRLLDESRLFYELGYPRIEAFCERELGLGRSTVFERLRVAKALDYLPVLRDEFADGGVSWQQVRAISRVATTDTEGQWIELAREAPLRHLEAQVRDAVHSGRDAPRSRRYGLPNLTVTYSMDITLEEKERIRTAFARLEAMMGGVAPDPRDPRAPERRPALVRFADAMLGGALAVSCPSGDAPPPDLGQTIVYHMDVASGEARVDTEEGSVRVSPERIADLAPRARRVDVPAEEEPVELELVPDDEVDGPTTARLRSKVLARDGARCAVPWCRCRHGLHAHHLRQRSEGGPSTLENEVTLCRVCHALVHERLLRIFGSPSKGLSFLRVPPDDTEAEGPVRTLRRVATLDARLTALATTLREDNVDQEHSTRLVPEALPEPIPT